MADKYGELSRERNYNQLEVAEMGQGKNLISFETRTITGTRFS